MVGKDINHKQKINKLNFIQIKSNYSSKDFRGDLQDGGVVRRGDHLPPHRYIRNTSTCGTAPTEHQLNATEDLRLRKRQETPHVPG